MEGFLFPKLDSSPVLPSIRAESQLLWHAEHESGPSPYSSGEAGAEGHCDRPRHARPPSPAQPSPAEPGRVPQPSPLAETTPFGS